MKLELRPERGRLTVEREQGDPPAKRGGYGGGDGWSMEHHFMHMVKRELLRQHGIPLVKIRAVKDGHMMDDELPVLRPPRKRSGRIPDAHNICIWDGNYQIRSAAKAYNQGLAVDLDLMRTYYR